MTTRFSLAELAEMLHVPVDHVRLAVDTLSAEGELTAESFQFGGRNWRIAPSDTKRIQAWIQVQTEQGNLSQTAPKRRVRARKVIRRVEADHGAEADRSTE
ncbi:hypothetical protein JI721_02900 [Alicyclobacillus cycloheptanicus]|jgi:hypothetical protein|uniref:Helix-turn-helix domain-containing protein n=1 Tax=Alicyclobacillus cycloheptanicus TaxID=1457 RepID=A0ABT9XLK9_9BACL|nr:hypothetical protein [Alicyclobacillus cycloheptanicus]MDQ0190606.1 hypothetical protein [Alicyclobacillus cycloheptanicus]WDM01810.1 hypothetical protein JI721_02900 [Alicyclobacillus cycloheptanicus]